MRWNPHHASCQTMWGIEEHLLQCRLTHTFVLLQAVAKYCPQAWITIISNPVNSTVSVQPYNC